MKKFFITTLTAVAAVFSTQAQELKLGVRAGLNLSNLNFSPSVDGASYKTRPGYHFGVLVENGFTSNILGEVGVSYSNQGTKINDDNALIVNMVNIPVWVKYDINGFRPKAGVQLGYIANAKEKIGGSTTTSDSDEHKKMEFGVGAGVEYNFSNTGFFVDATYNLGLTNIAKNDAIKVKNRVFQIGIGYKF